MRRSVFLWAMAAFLLAGSSARAALLVSDSFNYAVGTAGGADGGAGFSSAWTGHATFNVVAGNLGLPGYEGTGNSVQFSSNTYQSMALTRSVSASYGATGTELWVSYLTEPASLNAYSGFDLGTTFHQSLHIGILGGPQGIGPPSSFWGMDTSGGLGPVLSTIPVVYGQTTLLVVHITFQDGADRADLYVNPGSTLPALPAASKTDLDLQFSSVALTANHGNVLFDELRIGATIADVMAIPEPSGLAWLGVGAILVMAGRVHRSRWREKSRP